jgi:hypothetical protein
MRLASPPARMTPSVAARSPLIGATSVDDTRAPGHFRNHGDDEA